MIRGSCLCQGVRFEIRGDMSRASHCHCAMCRKAHGAAFGTYARARREDFHWIAGEELVGRYRSSPQVTRTFCVRCGATLQWVHDRAPYLGIALGVLDDDPGVRPELHIYAASKAPWYEITDPLPQHPQEH